MTVECDAFAAGNIHFQLLEVKDNRTLNGSTNPLEVLKKPTEFISNVKDQGSAKTYRAIFHFINITKKDFVTYTCMAGNSVGFSATSFKIKEKIRSSTSAPGESSSNARNINPIVCSEQMHSLLPEFKKHSTCWGYGI